MQKTILWMFIIFNVAASLAGLTIHSNASGGNWTDPNTWVEHVVPDSTMDVEVTSSVFVNQSVFCRDLKLDSSGILKNAYVSYGSHTLTIRRNLENLGIIANLNGTNAYYGSLALKLEGNLLFSDGQLINAGITFAGNQDQTITMSDSVALGLGINVSKPSGAVYLGSDFDLGNNTLSMGTRTLFLTEYRLKNGTIGNGIVIGGENTGLENISMGSITLSETQNLYGSIMINNASVIFNNNVRNHGTIRNAYVSYNSYTLVIKGDLINQGTIANHNGTDPYYGSLGLKLEGDLAFNDGQLINAGISLTGSSDQIIAMSDSVSMSTPINVSKPDGSILLGSDFDLGGFSLSMGNRDLVLDEYRLKNGTLSAGYVLGGAQTSLANISLLSVTLSGIHNLYGCILINNGSVVFNDNVYNYGTLRNGYVNLSSYTLLIRGDLINLGTITSYSNTSPSAGSLGLTLEGDFTFLDGLIDNAGLNLVGINEQTIAMSDSVAMSTSINISKADGSLSLGSDFNLGGKSLSMGGSLLIMGENRLKNGTLINGSVSGSGLSGLEDMSLGSVTLSETQNLYGSILINNSSVVFNNNVNNHGTIRNAYVSYGSYTLLIKGDLMNIGTITNNNNATPSSGSLGLNLEGNLSFQDGLMNNAGIILSGVNDQTISMSDSVALGLGINVSKPSGAVYLGSDFNLGNNTLSMGTRTLFLTEYRLKNGTIGNGIVIGGENTGLENLSIGSVSLSETHNLYGSIVINNNSVVFNNNVNNHGTIRNAYVSYGSYTLLIKGDLMNIGTITNNNNATPSSGSLGLKLEGNLSFQYGLFNNAGITLSGVNDQTIAMSDSVAMSTSINVTKPDGSISLGSDFNLGGYSFSMGNKDLVLGEHRVKNGTLSAGHVSGGAQSGLENISLSSTTFTGTQNLYGTTWISNSSVVFQNDVNNHGTIKNTYVSYGVHTLTFQGQLHNTGVITNYSGSSYYHGFLSLTICGSLYNDGTINCASITLSGVGMFTIVASNVSSPITISSSNFEFTGTNSMPSFTIASSSVCRVGENAILTLPNVDSSISGSITNLGRISLKRSTNNTSDKSFYKAIVRPNADYASRVSNLTVETNSYSIPTFFQDAVKVWWNLIPSSELPNLTLSQIVLQYNLDQLNGYSQSALEVVHSYDGISWVKLNSAVIDSVNHKVTISNAPGMGYYAFTKTSQVSGRVVAYNNPGSGLAGVMISHGNQCSITQTNANGLFSFNIPDYYACSVVFTKPGFNPVAKTIRVWASDVVMEDVVLPEELNTPDTFTAVQNELGSSVALSWGYNAKAFGVKDGMDYREFSNYSVYRFLYGEEHNPAVWSLLSNQTELSYTDLAWANAAFGVYRFAIVANYSNGSVSEPILSAQVQRRNFSVAENFDSGSLPIGWSVQHAGTTSFPWTPVLDTGTDYSLKVLNSTSNTASEKLLSATYNCSRYQKIQVSFWHHYVSNTNSSAIFQISTNGITWSNIQNFAAVADSGNKVFDISSFAANQSSVRFRWSFTATSSSANSWNLDDFCLSGYTPIAVYFADAYPDANNLNCHNRNVNIGITAIDDDLVDAASLQYRIDANGNGSYDPDETWNPVFGYSNGQILEIRVMAQYSVDANNLRYEFKGEDLAGNGLSYSGSSNQNGITDDYYINIDSTPPTPVTGLAATSISETDAIISWTPVSDTDFLRYELYISKTNSVDLNDISWLPADNAALGIRTTTSIVMHNLEYNCYYWFSIRALDIYGNASNLSLPVILIPISIPPFINASIPANQPEPAWQTSRTVTLGCSIIDYYGIENPSLKYRFDQNGNGVYDPSEAWQDVPAASMVRYDSDRDNYSNPATIRSNPSGVRKGEPTENLNTFANQHQESTPSNRAVIMVQVPVTFSSDGHDLHFEFQAQDINGYVGYSGLNGSLGISDDWIVRIDTITPVAIANLNQPLVTDTAVELTWDASSDTYFKTYEVYYGNHAEITLSDSMWSCLDDSLLAFAGSGSIGTQITDLLPHNFYRFRVRAIDQAGNSTPLSNEVHAYFGEISSPLSPAGFEAIRMGNDLNLSWQPVLEDVYGNPLTIDWYNIYVGFTPDFPTDQEHYLDSSISTSYLHSEVFSYPIQSLFYKITAEYGIGCDPGQRRFPVVRLHSAPGVLSKLNKH